MKLLLDTNVVCEAVVATPNQKVVDWIAAQKPDDLHLSVVTLGEITEGIARLPTSRRRHRLEAWRDDIVASAGERLLSVDPPIASAWGVLRARLAARGRSISPIDAFVAATAEVHGMVVVTRNVKHFEAWGGPILNPWREPDGRV